MDRYSNGEPITKERMEDEPWYDDYQTLLEQSIGCPDVDEMYQYYLDDYKTCFGKECPNKEQVLRWCVLLAERSAAFEEEFGSLDELRKQEEQQNCEHGIHEWEDLNMGSLGKFQICNNCGLEREKPKNG